MAESGPRATMGIFCGQSALLVCDRKCNKAWGEDRPQEQLSDNEDDVVWLADDELGDAPDAGQPRTDVIIAGVGESANGLA